MQTFAYEARDQLGQTVEGTLDVGSRDEALTRLRRDGLQVIELNEDSGGIEWLARGVRQSEIIYVTSQLAVMTETGITLSSALDSIAQQEANPTLKSVLADLKNRVEGGEDFSTALARHPQHFNKTYIALIKAAEQTGTLAEMLESIAGYLRGQLETKQKVRAAMAYPGIMTLIAVGVTVFLLTYILPKFEPLFSRKGASLPPPTIVMMVVSNALINYWYLWLAGAVALGAGFFFGRRTEPGKKLIDWILINLPVIGPLCRKVTISRSLRTLGTMVASGVSMLDAIRLTAEVAGNYYYEQVWMRVLDEITEGNRIVDSLRGEKLMPPTVVQMIAAGEETGKLDQVLGKVSSYYDKEVETSLKATTSLIEPLMICVMGVIVGGIALGLLLPIFSLSRPA
ncbi:MAG: type II secretion system F family protein [Pirellulaceae bacterium]|nr:type II secretion system F family protein [Pirellulaceae bacterium]